MMESSSQMLVALCIVEACSMFFSQKNTNTMIFHREKKTLELADTSYCVDLFQHWPSNGGPYNMEARCGYSTIWVATRNVHT